MSEMFKSLAAAAGILFVGTVGASAALLDFTASSTGFTSGIVGGVGYNITAIGGSANRNQAFDGPAGFSEGGLAFELDGIGIDDDEITAGVEELVVTFDRVVRVKSLYFLDLFKRPGQPDAEIAEVSSIIGGTATLDFDAQVDKVGQAAGFRQGTPDEAFYGRVFSFMALPGANNNDQFGEPDYALAAIELAPIPLPAAGLLLVGGLGALGALKRRKG